MIYLPFVDGLRALAIIAVVAYHAFPGVITGGFAGVDVFFVISGFLITSLVVTEISDGTFSLYRFFVRRARRLLPAAFACVVVVTLLSAFILLPDAFWYYGRSLLAFIGLFSNVFFYLTGGYFSAPALEKPLLHTWSLAVEDQFYLTWPLILMLASPFLSKRTILGLVLLSLGASLWFAEAKVSVDHEFAFFMLPARVWELLTGAALALMASEMKLGRAASEALSIAGIVAVLSSFFLLNPHSNFPGLHAAPACFGTAAIIAGCMSQNVLLTRLLSYRPLVFVGLISYSLYLWHWPLLALASYRLERPLDAGEASLIVLISVALAVISWRWVERPFRSSNRTSNASLGGGTSWALSDGKFVVAALSCVAIMAAAAGAIKGMKGFPNRYAAESQRILTQLVAGNPVRMECDNFENVFANDDVCNFGKKRDTGGSYELALFGDSMGDHWARLVARYAENRNLAGRQVTNGGCPLLFDVPIPAETEDKTAECAAYQTEAKKFIDRNPKLKVAVISAYWEKWLRLVNTAAARDGRIDFDAALDKTVRTFTDRGIKVVMIGQIPIYDPLPVRCIIGAIENHRDAATCGKPKGEALQELKLSNAALLRVAAANPRVSVSLPSDFMCQGERCSPMMDGVLLYKNGSHVNQFGAELLERFIKFPDLDETPLVPPS
ncbi:acyltransferase family protein [Hyphomicrobium sp.]|uniref:acyltransferase family protein n=1 Tax=Hyphomicrobium sp. TaxID=82 RepID=UPI001DE03441|nr:acyltransferase family protein [Hyphomicrobium sp.]MBY0558603.1 acyltransferase [Hyphomicrobium sp.]